MGVDGSVYGRGNPCGCPAHANAACPANAHAGGPAQPTHPHANAACPVNAACLGGGWAGKTDNDDITRLAHYLCGRGVGLTPTGDDMLAGWMAVGWLLYGPEPAFLAACEQIMEVARRQTHLLSRCWLGYAAEGNVALPVVRLLEALVREPGTENNAQLELAAQAVLAMGATSGYDLISGVLLGLEQFLLKISREYLYPAQRHRHPGRRR
jgi:hypothetical protein